MLHVLVTTWLHIGLVHALHYVLVAQNDFGKTRVSLSGIGVAPLPTRTVVPRVVRGRNVKIGSAGATSVAQRPFLVGKLGRAAKPRVRQLC